MADVPAIITEPQHLDAYALLSKPTKDLSDAEVLLIIADLRKRRINSLQTGKPDKPAAEAKAKRLPAKKATDAEKKANTAAILGQLVIPNLGNSK